MPSRISARVYGRSRLAKTSKTQFAVLGALCLAPMSGYDIKKALDSSVGNFWSENFGNIYPVLKRLERDGLVDKRTERGAGSPDRHVYSVTQAGRDVFERWLRSTPEPQPPRNELLLQVFFSHRLDRGELVAKLTAERERTLGKLEALRTVEKQIIDPARQHPESMQWVMTLRYGQRMSQGVLEWCDECLTMLEAQSTDDDP